MLLAALAQDMGLQLPDVAFDDMARGVLRRIVLDDGRPSAFLLAGDVRAHDALLTWADGDAAPASAAMLLTGQEGRATRARTVCVCEGVTDQSILSGLAAGLDVQGLRRTLGCGTGCGSCLPEIRRMAQQVNLAAQEA